MLITTPDGKTNDVTKKVITIDIKSSAKIKGQISTSYKPSDANTMWYRINYLDSEEYWHHAYEGESPTFVLAQNELAEAKQINLYIMDTANGWLIYDQRVNIRTFV